VVTDGVKHGCVNLILKWVLRMWKQFTIKSITFIKCQETEHTE